MENLNILVTSPRGKMGGIVSSFINSHSYYDLCALVDKESKENIVFSNIEEAIMKTEPQVSLIFSPTEIAFNQALICLNYRVSTIIGTTGFTEEQTQQLIETSRLKNTKLMIIPNFAIGAVLMMKFAQVASQFFDNVEIIEMHHPNKKDSPSGTAKKIADLISGHDLEMHGNEDVFINNSRGMNYNNVRIHSIRMEGIIASHQVVLGSIGETLTIKHDSIDRASFLKGIDIAILKINDAPLFTYGLEQLLD